MSIPKGPPDGGQGGRRGHSNMEHWGFTEEIKVAARKLRRLAAKREIKEAVAALSSSDDFDVTRPALSDDPANKQ